MSIRTKLLISTMIAAMITTSVWANDIQRQLDRKKLAMFQYQDIDSSKVMEYTLTDFDEMAIQSIELYIGVEYANAFRSEPTGVTYNDAGRLRYVQYNDVLIEYTYEEIAGELKKCIMTLTDTYADLNCDGKGDVKAQLIFTQNTLTIRNFDPDRNTNDPYEDDPNGDKIDPGEGNTDPDDTDKPDKDERIIYLKDGPIWDLEKIASTPPSKDFFKWIKEAIDKAKDRRNKETEEASEATNDYCRKVVTELAERESAFTREGIDLSARLGPLKQEELTPEEAKILLDEVVSYVESQAEEIAGETTMEFLSVFALLTDEYVEQLFQIHERSVEDILAYMEAVIEKLRTEGLALYSKKEKDKLDVYIDLNPQGEQE